MLNLSPQKIQKKQYLEQLESDNILNCSVKLQENILMLMN